MKSEVKYLVNPRIKEMDYIHKDIKDYIEKILFYKYGEPWYQCWYVRYNDRFNNISKTVVGRTTYRLGGNKEDEDKMRPFLFDTEKKAIIGVKLILKEMILESKKRIDEIILIVSKTI